MLVCEDRIHLAPSLGEGMTRAGFSWVTTAGCSGAALSCCFQSAGAEWVSLGLNGASRGVPVGWGHCLVAAEGQDQSLPLCTPVPGSAGVSEPFVGPRETMGGLAVGALLALQ